MGKKPPKPEKKVVPAADRHLNPKITLRLPALAGDALRAMAAHEDRTITAVVLRALREYAKLTGYPWPSNLSRPADPPAD